MLARSFRFDTLRLFPRGIPCKLVLLVAVLILAGCGGSRAPKAQSQLVEGRTFRFEAPSGWQVERTGRGATASHDSELVQVSAFPLVRAYRPALFDRVATELGRRMTSIAAETGGKVTGMKTVSAGGVKSHQFDVQVDGHVDEYTFVLIGKREYQLLCRAK